MKLIRKITGVLCLCTALIWLGFPLCFPSEGRIRQDVEAFSPGEPAGVLYIQSRWRERGSCQVFCVEHREGEVRRYRLRYRLIPDAGWECVQALEMLEG